MILAQILALVLVIIESRYKHAIACLQRLHRLVNILEMRVLLKDRLKEIDRRGAHTFIIHIIENFMEMFVIVHSISNLLPENVRHEYDLRLPLDDAHDLLLMLVVRLFIHHGALDQFDCLQICEILEEIRRLNVFFDAFQVDGDFCAV